MTPTRRSWLTALAMASGYSRTSAGSVITGLLVPFANAANAARGITIEDGAVLREGDQPRGVLRGLPVGVVGAALDVVDLLAIEIERHAQFDQRLHLALPRQDAVHRRLMLRRWPVPTADSATPPGPCTSTTRRPARWRLRVRVASSSIWPRPPRRSGPARDAGYS